jgi:competence protein ComEC
VSSSSVDVAERGFFGAPHDVAGDVLPAHALSSRGQGADIDRARLPGTLSGPRSTATQLTQRAMAWSAPKYLSLRRRVPDMLSLELARGTPLSFVPVFLAVGALGYFFAAIEPAFWMLAAATAVFGATALFAGRWLLWQLALAALFCVALGALLAKVETIAAGTRMMGGEITTRLTGRIVATDHLATGRVRLTLDVVSTERPKLRYAPDRVRISARAIPADARAGDLITGVARLLPPLGATRPGGYDFAFESYFDGIGATGFFLGEPKLAAAGSRTDAGGRFLAAVENARDALAARIRSRIGGAEGEIAAALITGVRAGIPEEVNEALRRTGLAHILSISGLHMALVAATIMGVMRLGFACFQNFASRHPVRKYAALVALIALAAYLFISGYQVAAQRSFIMIAIMLVAVLFDHAALTMRNLALAAIVVLAISPHEVVGPSFQMSFAATAALIGAYAAWSQRPSRTGSPALRGHALLRVGRLVFIYAAGLAVTSLLAGAATAIFGAYHFQRVSPLGLLANLAAMPVVSLLVMPFAVLGLIAMPFGLDGLAFAVMGEGLRLMLGIAEWVSERSPLDAIGMIAQGAVICLTVALILATLLTTWLRLAALPFLLAGIAFCFFPPQPKIFISEDGRLVALRTADGKIAVNRSRPNDFALQNWSRALATEQVVKPVMVAESEMQAKLSAAPIDATDGRFHCSKTTCAAQTAGERIVVTADAALARRACGSADLLVVDDATVENICRATTTLVITRRDLARQGSAMVLADGEIAFATAEPYRPWHDHRRFSREARGMAPWKPILSKDGSSRDTPVAQQPQESKNPAALQPSGTASTPSRNADQADEASTPLD